MVFRGGRPLLNGRAFVRSVPDGLGPADLGVPLGRAKLFIIPCLKDNVGGRTESSAMGCEMGSCLGQEGSTEVKPDK